MPIGVPTTPTVSLSTYLTDLRTLLHDPSDVFWSQATKTRAINLGIQRRDLDTGANRQLVTFNLTVGVDTYTFPQIGVANVFDVVGINLIFVSNRAILANTSFRRLNKLYRPWTPYQGVCEGWARYGPNQIVFGPTPSVAYQTEWDVCVYSAPDLLVNLADTDPMPYTYTEPVPLYAAHWLKLNERMYDESDDFFRMYQERVGTGLNSRTGMVPSFYSGR
ncbi:MAG: hypothetical protein E6J01_03950 [Chloroflexi bacterium]|nr:MAG: hypothetical protein E6J01_03950 [Chloroflexota bacterium]